MGSDAGLFAEPHRRYNQLTGEWVLVSAGRTRRPWLGREEPPPPEHRLAYDPGCFLCPGNVRTNGERNPRYAETFVFTNDFPSLRPDSSSAHVEDGLIRAEGEQGTCRVLCFSPRHDVGLATMPLHEVRRVVDAYGAEVRLDNRRRVLERFRLEQGLDGAFVPVEKR